MNLCIDIGNTKTKLGIYSNDPKNHGWIAMYVRKGLSASWLSDLLDQNSIQAAIVSNTKDYAPEIQQLLKGLPEFVEFDFLTPLPVTNHYATPETLGKDRLAAVCGAHSLFPKENVLVIDAGTCITMDMVSSKGEYFGGSIHPGITMRLKALNNYTGKLPLVKRNKVIKLVGNTTEESILAGVTYAMIKELEGMISDYTVNYGELKVIITGGDSQFFVSRLKSEIFAHSNLVLVGLNKILEHNGEGL